MRKVPKRARPRDPRIEAMQLLGKWTSLAQGHVLLGGSCSCGLGAGSLRVEEFEQQILDFLGTKYSVVGNGALARLMRERAGYETGKAGSLPALLRAVAAEPAGTGGETLALLADLKRTLESFDELHRSR